MMNPLYAMQKRLGVLAVALLMTACASSSYHTIAADARATVGKVTQKQAIQQYEARQTSPIDVNVGVGGGSRHIGWGIHMGLDQIFRWAQLSSAEVIYRYTVETAPNESFVLLAPVDDFKVNDCVTVWQKPSDESYPRLQASTACQANNVVENPKTAQERKLNPKAQSKKP